MTKKRRKLNMFERMKLSKLEYTMLTPPPQTPREIELYNKYVCCYNAYLEPRHPMSCISADDVTSVAGHNYTGSAIGRGKING